MQVLMVGFKIDRKWQLLRGLFSFIATGLIFFNIAINKKVQSRLSVAKWLRVLKHLYFCAISKFVLPSEI